MNEPFYTSHATVRKVEGSHRHAVLETGDEIDFGVHGVVKSHYKLPDTKNLPLPVDYIVAATGA